jgi:PAS domain S-box-containing protein
VKPTYATLLSPTLMRRVALVLPVLALALTVFHLWRLHDAHQLLRADTLAQVSRHAEQLAEAKASQIELLVGGADLVLRQVRDQYAACDTQANQATQAAVQSALAAMPQGAVLHFAVSDAQGALVLSTVPGAQGVQVADRDYFRFHVGRGDDTLHINEPVLSRSGLGWVILLTRPVIRQGRFAGVVLMSLSPHYVSEALARLPLRQEDVIGLIFTSGTYAARSRDVDQVLGKRVPPDRPFLQPGAAEHGAMRVVAAHDQRPRIYGWHKLRGLPLVLNVGLDEAGVLAAANQEAADTIQRNLVALPLVALMVGAISWLLYRSTRQQHHLLSSQALLHTIFDATADGILVVGDNGRVLETNQRFGELMGLGDELLARGDEAALLQHVKAQSIDPDAWVAGLAPLQQPGGQGQCTTRLKDGRVIECATKPFALGARMARLWSFRDTTERQRMEDALRQSDQRFRTLFESSPDAVLILDDLHIVECNAAAVQLFGHAQRADLLDLHPVDLSPPVQPGGEDSLALAEQRAAPCRRRRARNASSGCTAAPTAAISRRGDAVHLHPARPHLLHGVLRDITDRKRAEGLLRQSQSRVRATFDGARDGILAGRCG